MPIDDTSPAPSDWPPQNLLEQALQGVKTHQIAVEMFLQALVTGTLFVPSQDDVEKDDSRFAPILFQRDGVPLVAAFTHIKRALRFRERAPFALSLTGQDFLQRLPEGCGLVLNPGYDVRSEILPQGIPAILRDFNGMNSPD